MGLTKPLQFLFLSLALGLAAASLAAPRAMAAELIMLERPGCAWCLRWNQEVAPEYAKTAEGRQAPLRRVDVTQPWPADLADVATDRYTPTFIVVENGREIARLRGYPGEDFFWPLLAEMLTKLAPQDG
ncbi:transcriptional regulator [Pelagibius sp. 7325]|uniref:transcriptional regulator n=1 Tax=Pelagibius sp. 7325 TaxID=3131994 RepID=UPI0030EC28F3